MLEPELKTGSQISDSRGMALRSTELADGLDVDRSDDFRKDAQGAAKAGECVAPGTT